MHFLIVANAYPEKNPHHQPHPFINFKYEFTHIPPPPHQKQSITMTFKAVTIFKTSLHRNPPVLCKFQKQRSVWFEDWPNLCQTHYFKENMLILHRLWCLMKVFFNHWACHLLVKYQISMCFSILEELDHRTYYSFFYNKMKQKMKSPTNATEIEPCEPWSLYNSIFFSFCVMTTVGESS